MRANEVDALVAAIEALGTGLKDSFHALAIDISTGNVGYSDALAKVTGAMKNDICERLDRIAVEIQKEAGSSSKQIPSTSGRIINTRHCYINPNVCNVCVTPHSECHITIHD